MLTGRKIWITNGAEAGVFIVFANVDSVARATRGSRRSSSSASFPGFAVGKKEDKLGIRASSTTELILEQCRVPEENVLGPVGQGYKIAIETLNEGRIGIGAQMIGVAHGRARGGHRVREGAEAVRQGDRRVPGRPVPARPDGDRARGRAADGLQRGAAQGRGPALRAAGGDGQAVQLAGGRARRRRTALELFGGYGYTKEYPVEKFYRDAKIGTIYEGTSNMQLQTIAKALLK